MARTKREYPEIKLDDTYFVTSDSYNWTLKKLVDVIDKETNESTGEKRESIVGHFGANFSMALKRYVIDSPNELGKATVHDILDKLNEISKQIDKVVKKENIVFSVKDND